MGLTNFRNTDLQDLQDILGLTAIVGFTPTVTYFVDSNNGSSSYDGLSRRSAKATLAQALALCSDNRGNVIYLVPGHAETLSATAGVAWSQSGVTVIGGGTGRSRPALTCGAAAAVNGISMSGSNNTLKNVRVIGSDTQTTAYLLNVTGTDNTIDTCTFEHGAGPLRACGMTGASRTTWKNCTWIGTAAGPDMGIRINTASVDSVFKDLLFQYISSSGCDSAAIMTSSGIGTSGSLFENIVAVGMDVAFIDINGSHASISTGDTIMRNCAGSASAAVTLANFIDAGGAVLMGNWVTDAIASAAVTTGAVSTAQASVRIPAGSPAS